VCVPECPADAIVSEGDLSPELREKWDEINRRVSDWNVNIIDEKEALSDAKEFDGYPNKYEEFGIIPIKDIT
jgi:ferredoxin